MAFAARRVKEGSGTVNDAGFLPFTGKDVNRFIGLRMNMRRDGDAGGELAENSHAAGFFIFMQDEKFDAGIGAWLPGFLRLMREVLKHGFIQGVRKNNAMIIPY